MIVHDPPKFEDALDRNTIEVVMKAVGETHRVNLVLTAKDDDKLEKNSIMFNFTALNKPTNLFGEQNFESKHIRIGSNVKLLCPFKDFDYFKWFKDGEPFNDQSLNIEFRNVSSSDTGKQKWRNTKVISGEYNFQSPCSNDSHC